MKKIIILGSTGSIGRNVIRVVHRLADFQIIGLAAYGNYARLRRQMQALGPRAVALIDPAQGGRHGSARDPSILLGESGIYQLIEELNADILVCAFASAIGIEGILRAIQKRMRICLATKEILVSYGDVVMQAVKKYGSELLPVDSEHSAVFQCLEGRSRKEIKRIILTASGGPFLKRSLRNVKKQDVLNHPIWKMGAKITVDSATMMNKGLEVIEAHHLFGLAPEQIEVVIHPEALCHSLVEFKDGTFLAQLSTPDMRLPIQYALTYPRRQKSFIRTMSITQMKKLTFMPPDRAKFPCLSYAYQALRIGKSMPAVLNAANEEAVKLFLEDRIEFNEIQNIIKHVLNKHIARGKSIDVYKKAEVWARSMVRKSVC